ncbi:MAG: YihY/virulence factor BrkB family protein [Acidimicrobiia bacterium]|nr:YihY/virulence factor BrkB family protein [Acidimicrobiia bacterium]
MPNTFRLRYAGRFVAAGLEVLRDARGAFQADRAKRLSAGLAYYSVFALVPTIFLALAIAGTIVGQEATEGRLVDRLDDVLGIAAAKEIEDAVAGLRENIDTSGFVLISIGGVLYSASALFVAWRDTLEVIWDVPYDSNLTTSLQNRAFGALMPIAAGVVLATIIVSEQVLAFVERQLSPALLDALVRVAGTMLSTLVAVAALGLLYRHTPRTHNPRWSEVWPGTVVASSALAMLSWGYGLYLRFVGSNSVAGAASAIVVGLVFIYYVAQILLFGAEIIGVLVDRRHSTIDPAPPSSG